MNLEIFERLVLSVAMIGMGYAAYLLVSKKMLVRAESKVARFPAYLPGIPALVYFTTPTCMPCKTVQRPAIEQMKVRLGRWFQVIEVDASAQPEVAREWGVLSVPTTFVFDAHGAPKYVNHGVVNTEKLIQQLELEDYAI